MQNEPHGATDSSESADKTSSKTTSPSPTNLVQTCDKCGALVEASTRWLHDERVHASRPL